MQSNAGSWCYLKTKQNTPSKFSHISHLLGRILTMVMYFMINQTMKVYARKLKVFSTMLLLLSQVRSKVHLR